MTILNKRRCIKYTNLRYYGAFNFRRGYEGETGNRVYYYKVLTHINTYLPTQLIEHGCECMCVIPSAACPSTRPTFLKRLRVFGIWFGQCRINWWPGFVHKNFQPWPLTRILRPQFSKGSMGRNSVIYYPLPLMRKKMYSFTSTREHLYM